MYREQEFVEKCHCAAPAVAACAACGRARCAAHLERQLCNRCTQWIGREMDRRANGRWITAGVTGTVVALGTLVAHAATASVIGLPFGIAMFFGLRSWQRATLIKRMGPALAASKGELPGLPRNPTFDPPPDDPTRWGGGRT